MAANPYLQHLIADPTFGYLFPHRLAIAAFGAANEYQLNKHRPRLVEGQHYVKIRGADHVERLFYTLVGLLILADLVGTPQSQQFKQALVQHTQPGGAIVQAQPMHLSQTPAAASTHLYAEPAATAYYEPDPNATGYPIAPQPNDPAYLVAQYLQPQIERAIERSVAAKIPSPMTPDTSHPQIPQDTAALIFEAQRLAGEQARETATTLMKAQKLMAERQPTEIHVNFWEKADNWLATQDAWAMSLIAASVVALTGISAYFFVSVAVRQAPPAPNHSTQSNWR
ncbi:MAG TPA: hypothetical protein IGS53_07995 [Leptolyngbyaceae cyanobacterium M33_DOE_097]|uniref:Uncharacterized protein n=1 Tax=Oscillatoriales cyanobacterium SpSt-418 TaxID=2282169 RepID=A0A7C3KEK0_9CYAN|nr:hypothetical protein [Leptolyngbyaceae cyanobacterium M33_DOE_097]